MKKEKIKLIRRLEEVVGYTRFKVSNKSSDEDIDNVLNFVLSSIDELTDNFKPQIEKLLGDE